MCLNRNQSQICTAIPIASFVQAQVFFGLLPSLVNTFFAFFIEIFLK